MPRYEDSTRLYVGHLSSRTRSRDLEHIFSRYGRVRDVDMKRDYAFIEFSDPRDADDARYKLDGRDVDGRRITVEFARGVPRGPGGVREYGSGGPAPGSGRCFNCGIEGHWARDCKDGDWKNKCYRCGERGHVERSCRNSPKKLSHRRGRSYSRSPVRSYSPRRGRSGSRSVSPSRSYSRSRSPTRRARDSERRVRDDERRSRSPQYRSSKPKRHISPSETRKRSLTPDRGGYISNDEGGRGSPKEASRSPSIGKTGPVEKNNVGYPNSSSESPGNNEVGQLRGSVSPTPADDGNGGEYPNKPADDGNGGEYPRSSESP